MLTHKQVETMVDDFMGEKSWHRLRNSEYLGTREHRWNRSSEPDSGFGVFNISRPDRIYAQQNTIVVCEIKPEVISQREVMTGIGQLACLLPYEVKPYLVIPESQVKIFFNAISKLPWLGVLSYSSKELRVFQKSERDLTDLIRLPTLIPAGPKGLTREILWEFLGDFIERDGLYDEFTLKTQLEAKYLHIKVYYQTLGNLLTSMGFEQEGGGDNKLYNITINRRKDENYTV